LTFCERQHSINKWCRHVKEFDHRTAISIGEKVYVYKRPNSSLWQCASYFAGKNRRTSAKEESLSPRPRKSPRTGTYSFGENSAQARSRAKRPFARCLSSIYTSTTSLRRDNANERYVDGQHWRSSVHLVPFFGNLGISELTSGKIQEYRIHRHQEAITKRGKPPGRSTIHQEIVTLRQTLKTALRHGWLDRLPDFSEPCRSSPKISHRAWFSPEEYKKLYEATRKRAQEPKLDRDKLLLYAQKYPRPVKFELLESLARTGAVLSNGKSSASRAIKR
jgi:hypothetical protein